MGTGTVIALVILAVLVIAALRNDNRNKGSNQARTNPPKRIDHLHYIDPDEYECPVCHATFKRNVMVCPQCGTRFTGTREDMTAYDDELEEELDMDDWDEEN